MVRPATLEALSKQKFPMISGFSMRNAKQDKVQDLQDRGTCLCFFFIFPLIFKTEILLGICILLGNTVLSYQGPAFKTSVNLITSLKILSSNTLILISCIPCFVINYHVLILTIKLYNPNCSLTLQNGRLPVFYLKSMFLKSVFVRKHLEIL